MTPMEAIGICQRILRGDPERLPLSYVEIGEAAAILSKLGPFVEAAMQYSAVGDAYDPLALECRKAMFAHYRALVAPTKGPSDGG